jgi:hypothetical protein|tara:strand:- start:37 stop:1002 length:966 start_codon:yes stop_codon:yes gene_type:complete
VFKWKKIRHIFNPTTIENRPVWMNEFAQAPNTLIFENFVRVYFSCRPKRDKNGQFTTHSTFLDLDKKNLTKIIFISNKPVLKLGEKGCFDEFGTYPFSPIKTNDRFLAFYAGWTRCVSVPFDIAIGICESKDAKVYKKLGDGPVLSASLNEPFTISSPKIRKFNDMYYLFYVSGSKWNLIDGRKEMALKIRAAKSVDGFNWIRFDKNIIEDKLGLTESQASPDVIFKNGKYHMFFDYWSSESFRKTKYRTLGYAYSKDLINWTRDDSKVGITVSQEKNVFDNEMIAYPHVFEVDKKIYMLYLGNEVGRYGFGLAKLEGELA